MPLMDDKTAVALLRDMLEKSLQAKFQKSGLVGKQISGDMNAQIKQIFSEVLDEARHQHLIPQDVRDKAIVTVREDVNAGRPGVLEIEIGFNALTEAEKQALYVPHAAIIYEDGEVVEFPAAQGLTFDGMQVYVDGYIELVPSLWRPGWVLVVDEDAKLKQKSVNPTATFLMGKPDDFIAGIALFCPKEWIK